MAGNAAFEELAVAANVVSTRAAPVIDPYTGPAILSGRASGVCSSDASYGPWAPARSRGLAFQVEGGAQQADALCDAVRLITHATSLGGVETLIENRAAQEGEEHLPEGLVRVSVGCEHVEDLWEDLEAALG